MENVERPCKNWMKLKVVEFAEIVEIAKVGEIEICGMCRNRRKCMR